MVHDASSKAGSFKRAYKACVSCRKGKAKCEVEPGLTSCVRCRREQKDCIFPSQRSAKRKRNNEDLDVPESQQSVNASRANKQSLQRSHRLNQQAYHVKELPTNQSQTQNSSLAVTQPQNVASLPTPSTQSQDSTLAQTVVRSSSDAIGILFSVAEENESEDDDENVRPDQTAGETPFSTFTTSAPSPGIVLLCQASKENLALWSQHRFVRQGWFSAREAITYIDLFFQNLSYLSPVADYYYADHVNHKRLILEEPLLCCTLLMISSRYHILPGPGGRSRAEFIHQRLWKHCEHLIHRITFGMEKYSIAKTRTIGSIKALLLITEWHPRALHFPPENDGWDASLAPSVDDGYKMHDRSSDASRRWREEVFEPAKRSDRMSWMCTGIACTLAHELGIFEHDENQLEMSANQDFRLIRRQLFLYATQLSLRIGCTSILGQNGPQSYSSSPRAADLDAERTSHDREMMLTRWIDLTKLLKTISEVFFTTTYRQGNKKIVLSKRYMSLIEHFEPLLAHWYEEFKSSDLPTVTEAAKQILLVEYHYVRMFVSSTAMQALVERVGDRSSNSLARDYDFLRKEYAQDFRFIKKVRESSREIIALLTSLSETGVLQYCPARVFLRLVTASILLLKSISLGTRDQDVIASLDILDRCIAMLKIKRNDEMHLSTRYGMLIARHVRRFRKALRVQSNMQATSTARDNPMVNQNQQHVSVEEHDSRPPMPVNSDLRVFEAPTSTSASLDMMDEPAIEAWLAQPFDLDFAPFGFDMMHPASGLNLDSLDFLWNLPGSE